ncbi:MAG: hypothetical protein WCE79_04565, partial [Xanthobacteraceae bacterium]
MPGKVGTGFPSGIATNKKAYSRGATGGIAFAGVCGAADGVVFAGFSTDAGEGWGAACSGSMEPTACC